MSSRNSRQPSSDLDKRVRARRLVLVGGVVVTLLASVLPMKVAPAASVRGKITICHRTHSTTNPYRRITVSQNAVQNARHGGHDLPSGSSNPAVFDSAFSYAANNKYWGDIIPGGDAAGLAYNGSNSIAQNWTAAGKAVFAQYCSAMTPTEFYDVEITAGQPPVDVLADLNDQAANEDVALLASIGGTFTSTNMASWETAVTVTTTAATAVTSTTATLNGTLNVGSTSTVTAFRYGTSPTLATFTTAAATPSPVTNTTAVSSGVTGLSPATTYYFLVEGTTNSGTETEGILLGEILSFVTPATVTSSTTSTTAAPTSTTSSSVPESTTTSTTAAPSSTTSTTVPASSTTSTTAAESTTTSTTAVASSTTSTTAPESTTTSTTAVASSTTSTTAPESSTTSTTLPASTTTSTTTASTSTTSTTAVASTTTAPESSSSTTSTTALPSSTTSTTVSESTTTSTTVVAPATGGVRGLVWFDRNGNAVFDSDEWVLPGVTVTIRPAVNDKRAKSLKISAQLDQSTTTASDGFYTFEGLLPGPYMVTAAVSLDGFAYTSDSDGSADWTVAVTVVAGEITIADFAGLGRGQVTGQVFDSVTLQGTERATVECRWAGYDNVLGNEDDVTFVATANGDGTFDMAGVPYGDFTCEGRDPGTDRTSPAVVLHVFAAQAALASLPLAPVSAPAAAPVSSPSAASASPVAAPKVASSLPTAAAAGRTKLPTTGSDSGTLVLLAGVLLVVGVAIVRCDSRRASKRAVLRTK